MVSEGHENKFYGIIGPGNAIHSPAPLVNTAKLCFLYTGGIIPNQTDGTVDIADQSETLPVLSCGDTGAVTLQMILDNGGAVTCMLENKCALVKFTLSSGTTDDVRISNMVTKAQVSWDADGIKIEPSTTTGSILLNMPDSEKPKERWAILLPKTEASTANALIRNYSYKGSVNIPKLLINDLCLTATIKLNEATQVVHVNPYYSVGHGKIVRFAPGNLQYKAAGDNMGYRFAEHQWDFVGGTDLNNVSYGNVYIGNTKCSNNLIDDEYTGWIDLFGWGTANNPTNSSISDSDYSTFNDW